jgi:hypothetical protein
MNVKIKDKQDVSDGDAVSTEYYIYVFIARNKCVQMREVEFSCR